MPKDASAKTASAPSLRTALAGAALVAGFMAILLFGHRHTTTQPQPVNYSSTCSPYRQDKIVTINQQKITTEVAATTLAKDKGLGGRSCITDNEGMLFTFDHSGHYAFWMKDMKFPIDILWIGADHKVVGQEIDVEPSTYPDKFVNKDQPAQYVLELKASRSKSLGVDLGTPVNF